MKRIGLIGGVSWAATANYYRTINSMIESQLGGNNSADMVIRSLNMQRTLDLMANTLELEQFVRNTAQELIAAGADVIAVGSLTGHRYVRLLRQLDVAFIGLDDALAEEIRGLKGRVGIFTTGFALSDSGLMTRLHEAGAAPLLTPSPEAQSRLDAVIFGELAHNRLSPEAMATLQDVAGELIAAGASTILLGTTEFGVCAKQLTLGVPAIDATEIHCRELVKFALSGTPFSS